MRAACPLVLQDRRALQAWHYELDSAARGPCLAALLVSRGYLDQFLRTFGQVGEQLQCGSWGECMFMFALL